MVMIPRMHFAADGTKQVINKQLCINERFEND